MRQGPNGRRPRGRHHSNGSNGGGSNGGGSNGGGGNNGGMSGGNRPRSASSLRHQSFDSNCGDLRVRGNAWQVYEKYQGLARDAQSSGDRVTAENYLQHAEHYFRIIEAINEATAAEQSMQNARGSQPSYASQQPDVPSGYYVPAGAPTSTSTAASMAASNSSQPDGNVSLDRMPQPAMPAAPVQMEATVVSSRPQPVSPFFSPEEIDEHNREQQAVAAR